MTFQRFTGKQYLQIDVANNFGLDKKSWDERLDWFAANEDKLESLLDQAEEPALYWAGVQAWRAVQRGEAIGYPVSLDATSSGLQILACLVGDSTAAQLCNVVDVGTRMDAYTAIYEAMKELSGDDGSIDRKPVKRAVMTSLYGSKAVPREVFGEGSVMLNLFYTTMETLAPGAWELNQAFLGLWDDQATINSWVLPDNFHVHVKVMAPEKESFTFMGQEQQLTRMVNKAMPDGRSLGANVTHSIDAMIVREMTRRCGFDPLRIEYILRALDGIDEGMPLDPQTSEGKALQRLRDQDTEKLLTLWGHYLESGFLSARVLDYLHSDNVHLVDQAPIRELIASLPEKPFEVLSVHDCFRCLPHYGNDLREQYNLLLSHIARSDLLSFLLTQIRGVETKIGKIDPDLWRKVANANYALS